MAYSKITKGKDAGKYKVKEGKMKGKKEGKK